MVKYTGKWPSRTVSVERQGQVPYSLNPRNDLVNHSPDGFCWGYGGSGPSQCALAILADYFGPGREKDALLLYQGFKWKTIADLNIDKGWELTGEQIQKALDELEKTSF